MPANRTSGQYKLLQELLLEARHTAGLTQVQVAARLKRPQSFVAKYEAGERRLDVVEFLEVAKAIGFKPASLIKKLER